jgi:PAS domain S-box-containing protein
VETTGNTSPARRRKRPNASRDLLVTAGALVAFCLGAFVDLFSGVHDRLEELKAGSADLVLGALLLFGVAAAAIAALRIRDARREVSLRTETDARYRALVEHMPAIAYTWDTTLPTGQAPPVYVSPQLESMLGYTPEEWSAHPELWLESIHPDDREQVRRASDEADRNATAFHAEYRAFTKDGSMVWIRDDSVVVASDERGNALRAQGVMYDITNQKRAEAQLQEAENRFRTIVERVPAVAYVWDAGNDPGTAPASYISPQIERLLGYTAEEWLDDPSAWASRLHPDDLEEVLARWDDAVRSGTSFVAEYRIRSATGSTVWVRDEAVPVADGDSGRPIYQGVMYDITEQRHTQERLIDAEERFRTLVEQLPAVVYIDAVDEIVTAQYVSPQYERLTGYSAAERMGDPGLWNRMLHPDDREHVLAESDRTNASGEPFDMEYRIIRADGQVCWVHDQAFLVEAPFGGLGWQGVLMDVTDRKAAEEALGRRDRILEAAGNAAERFLRAETWRDEIDEVLRAVCEAGAATRAGLFENVEDAPEPSVALRFAWLAPDAPGQLDRPPLGAYPYGKDFGRWQEILSSGGVISGSVTDLPEPERSMIAGAGIKALIAVPVIVEGRWWGYISLDQCHRDRAWQPAEIDAIRVVASTLGAAVERERSAARLDETQARYRTLVEQIPAITYVEDASTGAAVYTSPQVATLLGYGPDEWGSHEQWRTAIHPDDRDRVVAEDERTNRTGDPFRAEYRLVAKDGHVVWVRDEAVLLHDESGASRYWQGVRFDITAEKAVEEQLRDAEERYRGLIETIPAVIYIDSVEGLSTPIYTSPQIEEILGYTAERWLEEPALWEQGLHPDDRDAVVAKVENLNEHGTPYQAEYRFIRPDGRIVWISDHAVVLNDDRGQPRFSQGVFFDITARKEAEEQLREAEERYRAIVEHVPAATYLDVADRSMRSVYVSPQIEEITGITPQEWIEDPDIWLKVTPAEDREAIERGYLEALTEGAPWSAEYRMQTRDGRTIWVHDETTVLHDADGNATFLQGVLMDITERKLAEQALRESEQRERDAAERLRALDEMKNTFLAAVSHELRSPLTSILGLAITLERTPAMDEADRIDLLERLSVNARKLDRLLKDLLDIDRLNRGIVEPQYRSADVGDLTRNTVDSLDALADRRVTFDISSVVLTVDTPKVERIVENLVMNAVRHTSPDRSIWIRVKAHGGGVLMSVEDDGPGVPAELAEVIFEPFRQGPSASTHAPGTGIGLSLVGRFAALHGGRAWVEDREGGGAAFKVFLPDGPGAGERIPAQLGAAEAV